MYRAAIAAAVALAAACGACGRAQAPAPAAPPPPASHITASPITASPMAASHITATPIEPEAPFAPTSFRVAVSGHGRPIILIPGLGCAGSVWAQTVAHFPDAETHTLTLAGFAGQPPIDAPLSATVRAELATYIRDRHLDHPIVIGHSLGGFIAFWLAETDPDLVGPTIAVDAFPALGSDPGTTASVAQLTTSWKTMPKADFSAAARDMFLAMANDAHAIEPVISDVLRSDRRTFADSFYELFVTDLRGDLPRIHAPVLVVLADGPFQDQIRGQVATIPQREVVVVPRTRHFVMFDDPAGFFRVVDAFLAKHRS